MFVKPIIFHFYLEWLSTFKFHIVTVKERSNFWFDWNHWWWKTGTVSLDFPTLSILAKGFKPMRVFCHKAKHHNCGLVVFKTGCIYRNTFENSGFRSSHMGLWFSFLCTFSFFVFCLLPVVFLSLFSIFCFLMQLKTADRLVVGKCWTRQSKEPLTSDYFF